jgi:MFS family permease
LQFSSRVHRILLAKGLRGFGDGFVSLLLPVYLLELGFTPWQVGLVATATLLGSGLMTMLVGVHAWRWSHRTLLMAAAVLMTATGVAFSSLRDFWPLMLVAFVGTLNPSGGDVSVFLPLEHSVLSRAVDHRGRTAAFARYSLVGTLCAALGALAAALPSLLAGQAGVPVVFAMQVMFLLYGVLGCLATIVYRTLPQDVPDANTAPAAPAPLVVARKRVYTLAALFSLDAFGGGFIVQSLLALWLHQRFGMSMALTATIFFWTGVLTALSYLVAVRIADRIGLVRTMVFTHLPSSVCLLVIPFVPDVAWAIALLLVRSALSQMDVPTRSSYVMAIVPPEERAAAASITSVPRSLAAAASPALAGYLLGLSTFGWPLIAGGAIKIVYDLLLLLMFEKVRPPEEAAADRGSSQLR